MIGYGYELGPRARSRRRGGSATPTKLARWDAATQRVMAGTDRARLLAIGSSHTIGSDARSQSWPTYLAASNLSRRGTALAGTASGFVGNNNYSDWAAKNSEFALGSFTFSGLFSPGGHPLVSSGPAPLTWTIPGATDTVDLYHIQFPGLGAFNYASDGGAATAVNTNGAETPVKTTIPLGAAGAHTLTITRTAGDVLLIGAVAYNSGVRAVDMLNAGWSGGASADFIRSAYGFEPLPAYDNLAPQLTIIEAGVNDCFYGTVVATFQAQLQTLVNACKAFSDVVLMTSAPHQPGGTFGGTPLSPQATRDQYDDVVRNMAVSSGVGLIDTYDLWPSWAAMSAAGQARDSLHPNAAGNAAWAAMIGAALDSM